MESGLIDSNGQKIIIPYYEIGSVAKKIVTDYVNLNGSNKEEFKKFCMNYTHYEPYLDFIILKLGYGIINPFVQEKGILFENDSRFAYLKNVNFIDKKTPYKHYPSSSDEDLKIVPLSVDDLEDSIISPDHTYYKIDRKKGMAHEDYFKIIFMEFAINNNILYEDFVSYNSDVDIYFVNRLGFLHIIIYEDGGNIVYNKNLVDNNMKKLFRKIKKRYRYIEFNDDSVFYNYNIDESLNMKEEMSDLSGRKK